MATCSEAKKLCLLSQTTVNGTVTLRMRVERVGVIGHEAGSTLSWSISSADLEPGYALTESLCFPLRTESCQRKESRSSCGRT
jgi:hypothetical protein